MKKLLPLFIAVGAACTGLMQSQVAVAGPLDFPACSLDFKKKVGGGMSEKSYKQLTAAQEMIGKEQYGQALSLLNELAAAASEKPYEYATIMTNIGWVHAARSEYRKAIDAMNKAAATGALPAQAIHSQDLNLAQMYFAMDDYANTLKVLNNWFGCEKAPKPEAYLMLSQVYAQMKRIRDAIPPAKYAIEKSPKPKDSWYQHLLGLYWEVEDFKNAAEVLRVLLAKNPDEKKYWAQLSGLYARINDDKNALAVLELAYRQGLLEKENELKQLAALYAYQDIPFKSAEVLEKGIQSGKIPANEKNWNAVAVGWRSAREFDRAIKSFGEAAKYADVGEYYFLMAEMYGDQEKWKESIAALQNAFKKGNLKNPGFAYMRLGEAKFRLGAYKESIAAFQAATKYGNTSKAAEQWANYVSERAQVAQIGEEAEKKQ